MYIDTHCHLDDSTLEENNITKEEIIQNAFDNDVEIIFNVSTDIKDSQLVAKTIKEHKNIYGAVGVHPTMINDLTDESYEILESLIKDDKENKIKAIGEFGLDYYWDYTNAKDQMIHFKKHLELAKKYNKTAIIHSRSAFEDTFNMLKEYKDLRIVIHCFTYNKEQMEKFLSIGCYISFSGIVTFKNKAEEIQKCAKSIPLNRMICETDTPLLAPVPYRGKPNQPAYVKHIYEKISELRDEEITKQIRENVFKVFNL